MHCPPVDRDYLEELWFSDHRNDEICELLNVTRGHLHWLARHHGLGRRPATANTNQRGPTEDPTEEEIRERAAAIRATWTPNERRGRMVGAGAARVEIRQFWFDRAGYSFSP